FTGREVIGGHLGGASALAHSWAHVGWKRVFGFKREEQRISMEQLGEYFRLYNIAFVVAGSKVFKEELDLFVRQKTARTTEGIDVTEFGYLKVYAMDRRSLSWLWKSAEAADNADGLNEVGVAASPNQIVIENAPAGPFVLKYHFQETLTCVEGTSIGPVKLLDDPVPFIRVDNATGLRTIKITNAY
ncbi:unnamed protein product, partial [marine sediment metagenome]